MITSFRVELLLPDGERFDVDEFDSIILCADWEYCEYGLLFLMTFREIKKNPAFVF